MKKIIASILIIIIVAIIYTITSSKNNPPVESKKLIEHLTLEEKLSQMFMIGIWENHQNDELIDLISKNYIGGILLMNSDTNDIDSLKDRLTKLQEAASIPLLISIDQEGGSVQRIKKDDFEQRGQAEINTTEEAYGVARKRGDELVGLNINMVFAPVLDAISDPSSFLFERTFRNSVDKLGLAMVSGFIDAGIVPVIKHFPGHGDSLVDSHKSLPRANNFDDNAKPFFTVLESKKVPVMTAHVMYEEKDRNYPATLSPTIINDLRSKFNVVIITDDMNMGAITKTFSRNDAATKAIQAGNDILLYVTTPNQLKNIYAGIKKEIESSAISIERINESVERILELKKQLFDNLESKIMAKKGIDFIETVPQKEG